MKELTLFDRTSRIIVGWNLYNLSIETISSVEYIDRVFKVNDHDCLVSLRYLA